MVCQRLQLKAYAVALSRTAKETIMELIIFFGVIALAFVFVIVIERISTELRGIRSVLMEHAHLEPVPVREHDPSRYQRKSDSTPA
jgi:hypothetical protein